MICPDCGREAGTGARECEKAATPPGWHGSVLHDCLKVAYKKLQRKVVRLEKTIMYAAIENDRLRYKLEKQEGK